MKNWRWICGLMLTAVCLVLAAVCLVLTKPEKTYAADEPEQYVITITPDRAKAEPGEMVEFTVTLGPVAHLGTMQMVVMIPDGLTYVEGSGQLAYGLRDQLGFDMLNWTEESMMINGLSSAGDYTSDTETILATFRCTVEEGACGTVQVGLTRLEFYSCETWEDYTSHYTVIPAVLNVHTLVKTEAVSPTGTTDGCTEYYTCTDCGRYFEDADGWNEISPGSLVVESLHKQFVRRMYKNALGRTLDFDDPETGEADRLGFESFTAALDAGMTGAEVASKFIFSSENWDKNLCNDCYIELLYQAVLGREVDETGAAYWKNVLEYEGLTRLAMFNRLVQPDGGQNEFAGICGAYEVEVATADISETALDPNAHALVPMDRCSLCGQSNVADFVTRLYITCLGRSPEEGDPELTGLKAWMAGLYDPDSDEWTGYSVAYRFVFGDEDPAGNHELTDQNLCNEHFVKRMYLALLDRTLLDDDTEQGIADRKALASYVEALEAGMSREELFDKFVTTEEYHKICIRAGITWGAGEGDERCPLPAWGEGTKAEEGKCRECNMP